MTSQDERFRYKGEQSPSTNVEKSYSDDTEDYFSQVQTPPGDETTIHSPEDFDLDHNKRDEEYAEEAIQPNEVKFKERESNMTEKVEAGWGWAALILSLIALFNIWPLVMGIAGIVVGVMAKRRGADTLGNIAIVAGIAAIVFHLIIDAFI
jgi:hypothetical protein